MSRATNSSEYPPSSRNCASDGPVPFRPISPGASRLKRSRSRTMRWNEGRARCERRANRPLSDAPLYSKSRTVADREAHFGGLRRDAESRQHPLEVRVGPVVQNDEAGVDVVCRVSRVHTDRVGVPAGVVVRLEESDLVVLMKDVGADQAGDAGPHDGDPHLSATAASAAPAMADPPASRSVPVRARLGRASPAIKVAPRSARSPPTVAISHGLALPPRAAVQAAPPASAMSRAPRPRRATCTGGCSHVGPSQLEPSRAGSAMSPSPNATRPAEKAIVNCCFRAITLLYATGAESDQFG